MFVASRARVYGIDSISDSQEERQQSYAGLTYIPLRIEKPDFATQVAPMILRRIVQDIPARQYTRRMRRWRKSDFAEMGGAFGIGKNEARETAYMRPNAANVRREWPKFWKLTTGVHVSDLGVLNIPSLTDIVFWHTHPSGRGISMGDAELLSAYAETHSTKNVHLAIFAPPTKKFFWYTAVEATPSLPMQVVL